MTESFPHAGSRSGRVLKVLRLAAAAALFTRLAGAGAGWLPPTGTLLVLVVVLLAADAAARRASRLPRTSREWRARAARLAFPIGVAGLAGLALLVRLPGIGADLGHVPLDIDEHRLASNVRQFFSTGSVPHDTVEHYPGAYYWVLTAGSLLTYLWALMTGAIARLYQLPVESFVLTGRVINSFIAAATVAVTAIIGRQLSGRAAGLLAAAIVAVVPLSVETTTVIRNDPAQVLLVCGAVAAALASCRSGSRAGAPAAGVLAGLATGIKYTSVFALVPAVAAAACCGRRDGRTARAALTVLAFGVALGVSNHFMWADFPNFVKQLADQVDITGAAHWAASDNPSAVHRFFLAASGPGWALLALAAAFGVYSLGSRRPELWVFWSFPVLYSWFTTQRPSQFPRWIYPLVPFVAVAGACALVWALAAVARLTPATRGRGRALRTASAAVLVLAVLAQPLWAALVSFSRRLSTPTHAIVEAWLAERAAGDTVLLERGWLDLEGTRVRVRRVRSLPAALQAGDYALYANDWIVVPEPHFGNPALRRLAFVERITADQRSLGGNLGYDFEIYKAPALPPRPGGLVIRLDAPEAAPLLGPEWSAPSPSDEGLWLPSAGASLYLPPREGSARFELDFTGSEQALEDILTVAGPDGPLTLVESARPAAGVRRVTGIAGPSPGGRPIELALRPGRSRKLRVLQITVE